MLDSDDWTKDIPIPLGDITPMLLFSFFPQPTAAARKPLATSEGLKRRKKKCCEKYLRGNACRKCPLKWHFAGDKRNFGP